MSRLDSQGLPSLSRSRFRTGLEFASMGAMTLSRRMIPRASLVLSLSLPVLQAANLPPFQTLARVPVQEEPTSWRPLPENQAMLLFASSPSFQVLKGKKVVQEHPLRGPQVDPKASRLRDFVPSGKGDIYWLDTPAKTVWISDPKGQIYGRFGQFLYGTQIDQGGDGRVYVKDSSIATVTGFDGTAAVSSYPSKDRLTPHASRRGEVAVIRETSTPKQSAEVGLLTSRFPKPPEYRTLGEVRAPKGARLFATEVIGSFGNLIYVVTTAGKTESGAGPTRQDLWIFSAKPSKPGPGAAARAHRFRIPKQETLCMSCGPLFRIGPQGDLWCMRLLAEGDTGHGPAGKMQVEIRRSPILTQRKRK